MVKPVVLVVEDEPLLRLFATDMIEEAGFEVLQAPNASAGGGQPSRSSSRPGGLGLTKPLFQRTLCSSPSHTGKTGSWTRSERWRRDVQRLDQLGRRSCAVHETLGRKPLPSDDRRESDRPITPQRLEMQHEA